jgi:hypothetical protein
MAMSADDIGVRATEYLLGLLEGEEAEAFRQLLGRDHAAQAALVSAEIAVSAAFPPVAAPAALKGRVLAAIAPEPRAAVPGPSLGAIRAGEGKWKPSGVPGITYKRLYSDKTSGLVTVLVRMEPGSVYPAHRHTGVEQCLVLEGDLIHDDHVYGPGDFTWAEAGSLDPELHTKTGNLLLIVGPREKAPV